MYFLRTEANFDAAHFLKDYRGKCGNIHGHRWRILCEIAGKDISKDIQNRGMLVDFKDIKSTLKEICEVFDHNFIYEKDSLKDETLTCLKNEGFLLVELRKISYGEQPIRRTDAKLRKRYRGKHETGQRDLSGTQGRG